MKKSLVAGLGLVGVLAVAGVAAVFAFGDRWHHGKQDGDVVLSGTGAACKLDVKDDLGDHQNKKVRWHIVNNCDTAQIVTFLVYRERNTDDTYTGKLTVVDPDPVWSKSLAPGGGKDTVEVTLVKAPTNHFWDHQFKYFACFGATANPVPDPIGKPSPNCLDPDVDIWP